MDFHAVKEVNYNELKQKYRHRILPALVPMAIVLIVEVLAVWSYLNIKLPSPTLLLLLISMFCIPFLVYGIYEIYKKTRFYSWFIATTHSSIYLHYRSYLYENPTRHDNTVLEIQLSEIEAFRETIISDIIPTGRSKQISQNIYLDIFTKTDLHPVEDRFREEYKKYGLAKVKKTKIEISMVHIPITMPQENMLRICISQLYPPQKMLYKELLNLGLKQWPSVVKLYNYIKE